MKTYNRNGTVSNNVHRVINDYDKPFDDSLYRQLLLAACKDVQSDFSRRFYNTVIYGTDDQLLDLCDINPLAYTDAQSYFLDCQLVALVKKYPHLSTGIDTKLNAIKTFIACEAICFTQNDLMLSEAWKHDFAVGTFLGSVREKIARVLGRAPSIEELSFKFGPGAAYSVKKNTASLDKLAGTLDVTPTCYKIARDFLATCPGWRANHEVPFETFVGPPKPHALRVVHGDRLSFVPKTAKTDRPIAIAPLVNGVLQKGIGKLIRRKLRPYLDLNKLQDKHRVFARMGSIDDYLSTIDLESASDTISYCIVEDLLPPDWFELLERCRSQSYEIEGKVYPYSKFSAMGNGYTFELETLLFYCIALSAAQLQLGDPDVSTYGDDIIVPTAAFRQVVYWLGRLGFKANQKKSFESGPFRESCGGDYFYGCDVRPYFHKGETSYRTLFLIHNHLVKTGWQHLFVNLYRFVRKVLGRDVIRFFKTGNPLDDGALLDTSVCLGSYNFIAAKVVGLRRNAKRQTYGVANVLYRLMISDQESEEDMNWLTYKTCKYRIKHKLYRHLHI